MFQRYFSKTKTNSLSYFWLQWEDKALLRVVHLYARVVLFCLLPLERYVRFQPFNKNVLHFKVAESNQSVAIMIIIIKKVSMIGLDLNNMNAGSVFFSCK